MPIRGHPDRDPENDNLTPLQSEFIDWLLTDPTERSPQSQTQWADQHDVAKSTVTKWKREDPWFQSALRRRAAEKALDPEALHKAIEAVREKASRGDVQAFDKLLSYVKWLQPEPPRVDTERHAADLTDEELVAELRALADGLESEAGQVGL